MNKNLFIHDPSIQTFDRYDVQYNSIKPQPIFLPMLNKERSRQTQDRYYMYQPSDAQMLNKDKLDVQSDYDEKHDYQLSERRHPSKTQMYFGGASMDILSSSKIKIHAQISGAQKQFDAAIDRKRSHRIIEKNRMK